MQTVRLIVVYLVALANLASGQTNFFIQDVHLETNGAVTLSWPVTPQWTYHVLAADSPGGTWTELPAGKLTAATNALALSYTDTNAAAVSQRLYKIAIHRPQLLMSLVLDRSGSMLSDGGAAVLPGAIATFINYFDDNHDKAALCSFASHARVDVAMNQPFKVAISNAVAGLVFSGSTCTEQGLVRGLEQNESVGGASTDAVKVIVFFTDGLANTFQYTFNCGVRNISNPSGLAQLYDPTNGNLVSAGCTIPSTISSITNGIVTTANCGTMHDEAEARALVIANQARLQGNTIYVIGLGGGFSECGRPALNPVFLQALANDPASPSYNPNQPTGHYFYSNSPYDLYILFASIANRLQTN